MRNYQATGRRIKFWWHLTLAYFKRYQLRIAIILITSLLGTYFLYIMSPNLLRNSIVTIGFVGSYKVEDLPTKALSLVTQPLIREDQNNKSQPALASSWTVSEDGKTYILFIRDNLNWHDSTAVEAKDISLAIKGVDVNAINNKTLQFVLPNPISSFPLALDTPVFKKNSFYGTGEYRMVDLIQTDNIVKKMVLRAKNNDLPRVEIRFYSTDEQALAALKLGEIKVLSTASINEVANWPNINLKKSAEKDEIVTIFFNTADNLLSSKEVRQALAHSINKEGVDGEITNGPISSKSWAYNNAIKKYDYNTSKAKELVSDAEVKEPKITLSYSTGLKALAEKTKTEWEAVGIKVEIKEEKGIPKEFQALLAVNKLPKDPDQYTLWHSSQTATNITKYKNLKIDKLLEDGRAAKSDEDRKGFYMDFQKFLNDDAPAIFLYHPNKYEATYKNVQKLVDKLPQ